MTEQTDRVPTQDLADLTALALRTAEIEQLAKEMEAGFQERRDRDFAALTTHLGAAVAAAVAEQVSALEARHVAEREAFNQRFEDQSRLITDLEQKLAEALGG